MLARRRATDESRFLGRVSTDDAQDPSLSIPRQLAKCDEALAPIGEKVGVTFWDVERGRKALEDRGKGKRDRTKEVKVSRAGGLPELLAAVEANEIDAAIVESIDRLSRMTADGTRIERQLEERDVALFAADEPTQLQPRAVRRREGGVRADMCDPMPLPGAARFPPPEPIIMRSVGKSPPVLAPHQPDG